MKKHDYPKKQHHEMITDVIKHEGYKIIAEIGLEKCLMTKRVLKNCGGLITQYWAVDIFEPNDSHERYNPESDVCVITKETWKELYFYACRLMRYFPQLHILKMFSLQAAEMFSDKYFDLVFLDSDHRYESTKTEIETWLPKIKTDGILSGHDYATSRHPGVTKAVDELFGDKKIIIGDRVWIKEV